MQVADITAQVRKTSYDRRTACTLCVHF